MKSITRIPFLAIFFALLLSLVFTGACKREAANGDARLFQEQVEEAARGSAVPGLVIALREPDGQFFVGVVGAADISTGAPMRVDSSFYIGTISQSMMAAMVFMLEEEGKLKLEDPLSRYLEFPGGESVTLEMLLDHSSGFADWTRQITD